MNINRNLVAFGCVAAIAIAQATFWERSISGYLGEGDSKEFEFALTRGDYKVDLTGGNTRGDLDCFVYNADGDLIGSDDLDDNNPIVDFRAASTGTYTVQVMNYGVSQSYRGNIRSTGVTAPQSFMRTMEGYLVESESDEFTLSLSNGTYRVDLTGRNSRGDLDCFVYNSRGDLVGSDELEDNNPIVEFRVSSSQSYTIKVFNYGAAQAYSGSIRRL
ncbi:MAG: PPC domain-containing protein [Fimbriimonadaceae bacterium]|nr:PPC domain-containing protein [Fimbriimonadaceae bacterium]